MDEFRETVWDYYRHNRRELPWREEPFEKYQILVSEVMLQQTQAPRVIPKYHSFLARFPNIESLANAPLGDVLREWSGLGYNRRAKYLHEAAKALRDKPEPWLLSDLTDCKGIGHNTASAVLTYAYNKPHVFIETNIRTVFIHHFLNDQDNVADGEVLPLVAESIDAEHPREFYYALMDYGTFIKKTIGNVSRQSKDYAKQSKFEGSLRQIRGEILRQLLLEEQSEQKLATSIQDKRLTQALDTLTKEGLLVKRNGQYSLT